MSNMYLHVCENIVYAWLLKKLKIKVFEIRPQNTYCPQDLLMDDVA